MRINDAGGPGVRRGGRTGSSNCCRRSCATSRVPAWRRVLERCPTRGTRPAGEAQSRDSGVELPGSNGGVDACSDAQ
jgi:hypothetical protein